MPPQPRTKISYEEFLEWMNDERHAEWVDGEIIEMSPVSNQHQDVAGFLAALLRVYAEARQLGEVRGELYQMKPAVSLPGRAPDIFFVATAHLDRLKKTFLEGPADLVVEVISPESRGRDRGEKFFEYEQAFPNTGCLTRCVSRPSFTSSTKTASTARRLWTSRDATTAPSCPACGCKPTGCGKHPCPRCCPS